MKDLIEKTGRELLGWIAEMVGGDWEKGVLIYNENDNPMVDAYNQGVKAMASQVCHYLNAIRCARGGEQ